MIFIYLLQLVVCVMYIISTFYSVSPFLVETRLRVVEVSLGGVSLLPLRTSSTLF